MDNKTAYGLSIFTQPRRLFDGCNGLSGSLPGKDRVSIDGLTARQKSPLHWLKVARLKPFTLMICLYCLPSTLAFGESDNANPCPAIQASEERLRCYDDHFQKHPTPNNAAVPPSLDQRAVLGVPTENQQKLPRVARLQAIRRGEKQKMVFLLENGEIWLQSAPRDVAFYQQDKVTITRGVLGGHFMRNAAGVSTRVVRIR